MPAVKLQTVLELMVNDAALQSAAQPVFECKMGWCTQCSCDKGSIEQKYGNVEYRSEPTIPALPGKILPCIMTQRKLTLSMDGVSEITLGRLDVEIDRQSSVLARIPKDEEVGTKLKVYVRSGGKIIVGSRPLISGDDVIVRNPNSIDGKHYTDMLVSKVKFIDTYGKMPFSEFSMFNQSKPIPAVKINEDDLKYWPRDADGKCYYKKGPDTFEVQIGTIITINGNALTETMLRKVKIRVLPGSEAKPELIDNSVATLLQDNAPGLNL